LTDDRSLAQNSKSRKKGVGKLIMRVAQVRALVLASLALFAGCIIDNDRVRVESFVANSPDTFVYTAQTNTVMTANDDGEAERIRRDWLAEELTAHGMCPAGYAIEIRQLVEPPEPPATNAHDIIYKGRCLQAAIR
jgi:hypothetical protein